MPSPDKKPAPSRLRLRFGKNVARLRLKRGLTQEKLAERIDKSVRYTQSIEVGEYWPSLPTLSLLRKVLRCSWGEILAGA